ncbi:MBL fold metallo-hydrolase [Snodgrassella sp. CFCC 13594]|uniref:MBL fold metallo-hydrolase n=1 Tax=Snodgrassella sp. CFCC 13594 TaxID=1775559 RepID=UPI000830BCE1|nr:MBL fold metallo-hydrolase [Snodgrassella sp. CFCC 13594]
MALQFTLIPVTPFQQNTTLLWDDCTLDAVLIDVGGDVETLLAAVAHHHLQLQAIWLTHGHLDHVGGVVRLIEKIEVPIYGPGKSDDFWLQQLPEMTARYGFPVSPVFQPTQWLVENKVLHVGSHAFQVLHIPGHTPGHVVFYSAADQLLIAGDVLFRESIGRTDFPQGNHADLLRNIREKLWKLPDETQVIPGHGPMTTIGHEKRHNPFL